MQPEQLQLSDNQLAVAGWENLPSLAMKVMIEHPYIQDVMKVDLLKWEFSQVKKKYKPERYFGTYCGLVGEISRLATIHENGDSHSTQTMFFCGWLSKLDFDTLMEIVPSKNRYELSLEEKEHGKTIKYPGHVEATNKTRNKQILFPGVTAGFETLVAAKNHLKGRCESKQIDPVKVIFQVYNCNTWTLNFVLGPTRKIAHRLCAVVDSYT